MNKGINILKTYIFPFAICSFAILHFLELITHYRVFLDLLNLFGLISFICGLLILGRIQQTILPILLTLFALIIVFFYLEYEFQILWDGLSQMRDVIIMLLVVPMVGWVLQEENILKHLLHANKKMYSNSHKMYINVIGLVQILSNFVLVGVVSLIYQFLAIENHEDRKVWKEYKSKVLLRGFALSTMWVLSIPSFSFAVDKLGASLSLVVLQGFFASLIGIIISIVLMKVFQKQSEYTILNNILEDFAQESSEMQEDKVLKKVRIRTFSFLIVTLFGSILVLNLIVDWGLITIITIIVAVWTVLYFTIKKKFVLFSATCKTYYLKGIPNKAPELSILSSAGFVTIGLGAVFQNINLEQHFLNFTHTFPSLNILWLLPLLLVIFGWLGLGPLPAGILIVGIVSQMNLPYYPELIVLSVTAGSALSFLLSPTTLAALLLSGVNKLSPLKNTLVNNGWYAVTFFIFIIIYIELLSLLYGVKT